MQPDTFPTADEIKKTRDYAGLTQDQAAKLLHVGLRTYQGWEQGEHNMHPAFFELFQLKIQIRQMQIK